MLHWENYSFDMKKYILGDTEDHLNSDIVKIRILQTYLKVIVVFAAIYLRHSQQSFLDLFMFCTLNNPGRSQGSCWLVLFEKNSVGETLASV